MRGISSGQYGDALLNHMLQLIDGVFEIEGIYIIAATNRSDIIDPALKRPGRLEKTVTIPLPGFEERKKIFEIYLNKLPLDSRVSLDELAKVTEGCSGAVIAAICNQAGLNAFKGRNIRKGSPVVSLDDLAQAINQFVK
ncbi:MAG: AAA family ATPase [Candidatus Dadabacteria bacterium]|nr:MAG: AAA family ATPase [Candidatus Dadabacteria bacterium]